MTGLSSMQKNSSQSKRKKINTNRTIPKGGNRYETNPPDTGGCY